MRIRSNLRGTRGSLSMYESAIRYRSMRNKQEVRRRVKALDIWKEHGIKATIKIAPSRCHLEGAILRNWNLVRRKSDFLLFVYPIMWKSDFHSYGRHEGLKIPCWQQHAGSIPACGTNTPHSLVQFLPASSLWGYLPEHRLLCVSI